MMEPDLNLSFKLFTVQKGWSYFYKLDQKKLVSPGGNVYKLDSSVVQINQPTV